MLLDFAWVWGLKNVDRRDKSVTAIKMVEGGMGECGL